MSKLRKVQNRTGAVTVEFAIVANVIAIDAEVSERCTAQLTRAQSGRGWWPARLPASPAPARP